MKRTLLPAVLTLAVGTSLAFAQAPVVRQTPDQAAAPAATTTQDTPAAPAAKPHHPHDPNKEAARLAKQLSLTPDQQAKVAAAYADRDTKMQALQANTAIEPGDMKKQSHRIQKETNDQLGTILTLDQLTQMKSMPHGGGHHAPPDAAPATPPQA